MKLSHIWSWVKILTGYFSLQLLLQAVAAIIGIVIVRAVDKHEYAYYAVCNAFFFAASNLNDCGVTAALSAIGGKLWHDRSAFGSLLNTAYSIRRWLTVLVVIFVVSTLPVMLFRNGAGALKISSLTVVLIVSILFQFGTGVYQVVPQLKANYALLQKVALYGLLLRAALLALAWLTILNALTAVLINCAAFALQMWLYKWYAEEEVDLTAKPDAGMRKSILSIIRKQFPYEVYSILSSQISIVLLTLFGTNSKVADVGALTRIGMLFVAMTSVMTNVLLPRFARCQDKNRLTQLFWRIILIYVSAASSVLVLVWFFPDQFLLLLGRQYSDLGHECFLAVAAAFTGAALTAIWSLNMSRGWIIPAWIGLSISFASQAAGILIFDVHTVHGVLLMSLFTNCASLVLNLGASMRFLHNAKKGLYDTQYQHTSLQS